MQPAVCISRHTKVSSLQKNHIIILKILAVTRRNGVYGNKSGKSLSYSFQKNAKLTAKGTYDFNSDLTEPIMKYLASHWEKNFSRRIPSVLRSFTTNANLILKKFHQAVESRSCKNRSEIAGLSMLSQQLRTYEATFSILTTEMVEAINNLQRDANREFVPVIARNLAPSYQYCASERGTLKSCSPIHFGIDII